MIYNMDLILPHQRRVQFPKTMTTCPEHGHYYELWCGTSCFRGSAIAEHSMTCVKCGGNPERMGFFAPNDGVHYPSWEAPAPHCPSCWHRDNPDLEKTEFSKVGKSARRVLR